MTSRAPFVVLALAAAVSGCVSVLPEPPPPPRIYQLAGPAPPMPGPQALSASPAVVAVALPGGPRALMGAEIAWSTDGVFRYVAGAEWAGRAPDLLQTALAEAVDASGQVRAGVRAGAGVRADYEIAWDVTAFQVEENDGAIIARFGAVARLVDARSRMLVAQTRVEEVRPVAARSQAVATQALETATRDAVARIARDLAAAAAAPMPPPSGAPAG